MQCQAVVDITWHIRGAWLEPMALSHRAVIRIHRTSPRRDQLRLVPGFPDAGFESIRLAARVAGEEGVEIGVLEVAAIVVAVAAV